MVTTESASAVITTNTWTESTTAITITANTALTASTAYTMKYWCEHRATFPGLTRGTHTQGAARAGLGDSRREQGIAPPGRTARRSCQAQADRIAGGCNGEEATEAEIESALELPVWKVRREKLSRKELEEWADSGQTA